VQELPAGDATALLPKNLTDDDIESNGRDEAEDDVLLASSSLEVIGAAKN
jgi:hypothetical protein